MCLWRAGKRNSRSPTIKKLPQVWESMAALHANTIEAPVYWEQFEPEEGHLDFTNGRPDSGHPDRCLVGISLILSCRAWSKLDVQVVVCNCVGDPFEAWVAGSNPAALTI